MLNALRRWHAVLVAWRALAWRPPAGVRHYVHLADTPVGRVVLVTLSTDGLTAGCRALRLLGLWADMDDEAGTLLRRAAWVHTHRGGGGHPLDLGMMGRG